MPIIGHGVDIVQVVRIRDLLADHADRFLERCFTPIEQAHGQGTRRHAEHIAVRFAAKEAAMKALGTGLTSGVSWTDFSIESEASNRPRLIVRGQALVIAHGLGISAWHVSLSHTDTHAMASVIAEA